MQVMITEEQIQEAKSLLRKAGYFTDNLWHVDDVKSKFEIFDNEDAQDVLNDALTNEWVIEQIRISINNIAEYKEFKKLGTDE